MPSAWLRQTGWKGPPAPSQHRVFWVGWSTSPAQSVSRSTKENPAWRTAFGDRTSYHQGYWRFCLCVTLCSQFSWNKLVHFDQEQKASTVQNWFIVEYAFKQSPRKCIYLQPAYNLMRQGTRHMDQCDFPVLWPRTFKALKYVLSHDSSCNSMLLLNLKISSDHVQLFSSYWIWLHCSQFVRHSGYPACQRRQQQTMPWILAPELLASWLAPSPVEILIAFRLFIFKALTCGVVKDANVADYHAK